jgi:hypothetical protein
MAERGDSPIVIQWAGGHTDFKTTQGYIDRGRVERHRIGRPLPRSHETPGIRLDPRCPRQGFRLNGREPSRFHARSFPFAPIRERRTQNRSTRSTCFV